MKKIRLEKVVMYREHDVFETGCQPGTTERWDVDINETFISAGAMLDRVNRYYADLGLTVDKLMEYRETMGRSSEWTGKIEYQLMVNEDWNEADFGEIDEWKLGKCKLYLADVFFYVSIVEEDRSPAAIDQFLHVEFETEDA